MCVGSRVESRVSGRARIAIVACVGGVTALAATALWLSSRPDAELARWSAVATVVSGVVTVLALAVAIAPLCRGQNPKGRGVQPPRSAVTQTIHSNGPVNVVGEGSQVNVDLHLPPSDGL